MIIISHGDAENVDSILQNSLNPSEEMGPVILSKTTADF